MLPLPWSRRLAHYFEARRGYHLIYDGRMVGLSSQAADGSTLGCTRLAIACTEQLRHYPDQTVDKSLFWIQTSVHVQTFLTNAIEGI